MNRNLKLKNKIILIIMLAILIVPLLSIYNVVQADSEENSQDNIKTQTVNDSETYSSEIKEEQVQATDSGTTSEDWTDFSNAKYELKKDGISGALVEATGVSVKTNRRYYIYISSVSTKPEINNISEEEKLDFEYNEKDGKFVANQRGKIAKFVELNQDIYINVIERNNSTGKYEIVSYGNKVERFAEAKYSDAFHATHMTNGVDQIITTFTHAEENNRKIQIKIGKISNTTILNKLKNQDATGFYELLEFAKSGSAIYNETLNADKNDSFAIEYNTTNKDNAVIDIKGLQDKEYYYLYIKPDDENGKYVSNEAVTLAQANVYNGGWGLFFYGSSDFKWADFGNINENNNGNIPGNVEDDSIAPVELPHAGSETLIWIGVGAISIVVGAVLYSRYKKYQGI